MSKRHLYKEIHLPAGFEIRQLKEWIRHLSDTTYVDLRDYGDDYDHDYRLGYTELETDAEYKFRLDEEERRRNIAKEAQKARKATKLKNERKEYERLKKKFG